MIQTGDTTTNNTLIQIGIVDNTTGITSDINAVISDTQQESLQSPPVIIDTCIITDTEKEPENSGH